MWNAVAIILQLLVFVIGGFIAYISLNTKERAARLKNSKECVVTIRLTNFAAIPIKVFVPSEGLFLENMKIAIDKKLTNLKYHWNAIKNLFVASWAAIPSDLKSDLISMNLLFFQFD